MSVALDAGVAIYVSMAVALSVWIALFIYLWRLDAQARELKRLVERDQRTAQKPSPSATITRIRETAQEPVEK